MWTSETSLAEMPDGFSDEDEADLHGSGQSQSADDRAYLILLYREHASQARQQETLRSTWTCIVFAAIVALLALSSVQAGSGSRSWITGLLVCFVSALGAALNQKHYERYELHLSIMRSFRAMLALSVRHDIPKLTMTARIQHNRQHRVSRRLLGLQGLWRTVYFVTFLVGAALAWSDFGMELAFPASSAATAGDHATKAGQLR